MATRSCLWIWYCVYWPGGSVRCRTVIASFFSSTLCNGSSSTGTGLSALGGNASRHKATEHERYNFTRALPHSVLHFARAISPSEMQRIPTQGQRRSFPAHDILFGHELDHYGCIHEHSRKEGKR